MLFSAALFPIENFYAGVSKIYGPCDLLLLDASCCTWHVWILVIPIQGEIISQLNGPSGSGRVQVSTLSIFCVRLKYFSKPAILLILTFLNIYKTLSCISKMEIIGKTWRMVYNSINLLIFPLQYFATHSNYIILQTY